MTEIEGLVRSRGGLRAQVTVVKKNFNELTNEHPDLIITSTDEIVVERLIEKMKQLEVKFDDVQSRIESLVEEGDLEKEYMRREEFSAEIDQYINSMTNMLDVTRKVAEQAKKKSASTTAIQLPAINLPRFNGDPEHWLGFRDTFESLIHNRNDLSEIHKFHYLKSSLGSALPEIFENLQFSSANYEEAWESLCDRFNDVNLLADVHLRAIIHMAQMKQESSTSIHCVADVISNRLKALNGLGFPTEHWGAIMKFITEEKLHPNTREKWDEAKCSYRNPSFENLMNFLKARANILQAKEIGRPNKPTNTRDTKNTRSFVVSKFPNCSYCDNNEHQTYACPQFAKLQLKERLQHVNGKRLCLNCLKAGHMARSCPSISCKICNRRHHTLLHAEGETSNTESIDPENVTLTSHSSSPTNQVLLSTISIKVLDRWRKAHIVRALLDVGSQSSFITHTLSRTLNLIRSPIQMKISGLNETHSEIKERCSLEIFSKTTKYSTNLDCLIVPQITGHLPNFKVDRSRLNIPSHIKLADPDYHTPGPIDILIGADRFYDILCIGQIRLASAGPILQQTRFGWVIGGPMPGKTPTVVQCHLTTQSDLERQVARFWEIEEFPDRKPLSKEEEEAERQFMTNTTRSNDGRFIVKIPLRTGPEVLGDSRDTAVKRFLSLERKLKKNPEFSTLYRNFMQEYRELGHMVKININNVNDSKSCYYMPHHGILKQSDSCTKLRVVFDSSCPTSSGYSFNDIQIVGPTIQSDLCTILMRFRKHQYAIVADVEKMYRMCTIVPQQRSLQRIIWRDDPNDNLDTYELTTVTYGTSAAPFLAIRCLYQLALECRDSVIAEVIKDDFYVDDLLSGASTITETAHIAETVKGELSKAGFNLCKFVSNCPIVLRNITLHNNCNTIDLGANENAQTLGMIWNAREDCFLYKFRTEFNNRVTKRTVLSESSQIFDPLGLLSPTTIVAKLILRDTWLEKLEWDASLSLDLYTRWVEFRSDLGYIRNLKIPRTIVCCNPNRVEAHIFSDASTRAYGACLYLKSVDQGGNCSVKLVCAKSKVCPVKPQTVPRLELVAALLACRLLKKTIAALKMDIETIYYWTDSSVVLGWIRTPPNLLEVFIANRVAEIQNLSQRGKWRHVPTQDNPADIISRGIRPRDLEGFSLYWAGPRWLCEEQHMWPEIVEQPERLPELKRVVLINQGTSTNSDIFERYSNLSRLERIVAYLVRFCKNCCKRKNNEDRHSGPLTHLELNNASIRLSRLSQQETFGHEIQSLLHGNSLEKSNHITKWHPFLDADGVLRVGGRLSNSSLPYDKRHPILLSDKSRYARLLFSREHKRLLHAGPSLLLAHTRNRFWTLRGRNLARKTVHDCITCFRQRPTNSNPLMGSLPASRVQPAPPFYFTGVDYAGPFKVKDRQGRGCQITKAYICVFVCFVTRAIHIELSSDLTSECFIAAFRRFVSRRGKPIQMYSDNGTNFIGAHAELQRMKVFLRSNEHALKEYFENENIPWSFIPPHSPHFGGLWEAGVKSAKHHLLRVAGNAILTFEQFYTLLAQIEAVLNSRPMYPLSSDPSDLQPITPGHFLIGRALTALPDECLLTFAENRLKLYQRLQQLLQHFWSRWYHEYIAELQQRRKWTTNQENLQKDELVLIKEDNLPPLRWALGRITDLHPGKDGIVRVVSIRTKGGTIKRPVVKLCRLPRQEEVGAPHPQSSNGGSMSRPSA